VNLNDLCKRFPTLFNILEKVFFKCIDLGEKEHIRRAALMTIMTLALDDLIKLNGGEIVDLMALLSDKSETIKGHVEWFLFNYHKKDSQNIYNLVPTAIGQLMQDQYD